VLQGANWLTFGGDPQRTGWAKSETTISKENAKSLDVVWKLQLDNQAKELNSLTTPVLVEAVYTPRGVKDLAGCGKSSYGVPVGFSRIVRFKVL
jgi:hypothetical protein